MSDEARRQRQHPFAPTGTRGIRVFISSTFCDMQKERDLLIKKVFPQLRKLCEERAVTWSEVDLRWGITTEQAAEGLVLPLCLEEIRRCRPYFIGLLGDRYGWVPDADAIAEDLLTREPWLQRHAQSSVTELEIVHGVFNEKPMHGRARFYFKAPDCASASPESADASLRLSKLKQRIRTAHAEGVCALRENYTSPEELAEWVLEDFTSLIENLYPKESIPNALAEEALRHEAYARGRRLGFVGRENLLLRLDRHFAEPGDPIMLTGESGSGKSALIAEWVSRWREQHPEDLVIQHFIGSTPDSADWRSMVARILNELKQGFGLTSDVPILTDDLRSALADWAPWAIGSRRIVLVIDALNQLTRVDAAEQLAWLPSHFPANFKVLVSATFGESLSAARERGWTELEIPLFGTKDIISAAEWYFQLFSKTAPREMLEQLISSPATRNPLYLRAVLDELRQFGHHEELLAKTADYLAAPDLSQLYSCILTRWHTDFGMDPRCPDLVRRSFGLIACARFGLSEAELLDLLGVDGDPMPHRLWTPLYLAAENALAVRSGLLSFGHDHLRTAVEERWLIDDSSISAFRSKLAHYFARAKRASQTNRRSLDETPWQFRELAQWGPLCDFLTEPTVFLQFSGDEHWKRDLHDYWRDLVRSHFDPVATYKAVVQKAEQSDTFPSVLVADLIHGIAEFHFENSEFSAAESMFRRVIEQVGARDGQGHVRLAAQLTSLGQLLEQSGKYGDAELQFRRAVEIAERAYGERSSNRAVSLNNLAQLLTSLDRFDEAEQILREALSIVDSNAGERGLDSCGPLTNLARLLQITGRAEEAEKLARTAAQIVRVRCGANHPDLANALNLQAHVLLQLARPDEAEPLFRRALAIKDNCFGNDHLSRADTLRGLGFVMQSTGDLSEAERLFREALRIDEQALGPDHGDVATDLNDLGAVLLATGRLGELEGISRRALLIDEGQYGPDHSNVARDLNNLSVVLHTLGRTSEAVPMVQRALSIGEKKFGPDDLNVARDTSNLAMLLMSLNRLDEAEPLMRRVVMVFLRSYVTSKSAHPRLLELMGNYVALLERMGGSRAEALQQLNAIGSEHGIRFGDIS